MTTQYWKNKNNGNYYEYICHSVLATYGKISLVVDEHDLGILVSVCRLPHRQPAYTIPEKIFLELFEEADPSADEELRVLLGISKNEYGPVELKRPEFPQNTIEVEGGKLF